MMETILKIIFLGEYDDEYTPGEYYGFFLTGAAGILNGFSNEFIAKSFHMMTKIEFQKLIEDQSISNPCIKINEGIKMPDPCNKDVKHKLVFNLDSAKPCVEVKNGGTLSAVTCSRIVLEGGALFGPIFTADSSVQLSYVTKGSGRVQIVGPFADEGGIVFFSVVTSSKQVYGELSGGKKSIWEAAPPSVLEASLNMTSDLTEFFKSKIAKVQSQGRILSLGSGSRVESELEVESQVRIEFSGLAFGYSLWTVLGLGREWGLVLCRGRGRGSNPESKSNLKSGVHLLTKKLNGKKRYHPIGGTTFNQLINFHRLHDYMTDLAGKYETFRLISPFRSKIYTSDPANVEYILKTNFDNYGKGWYNYSVMTDLFGDGIFVVDDNKWREQRKLSSHEFSTRVLRDFSSVVFRKKAAKLAHILSEAVNSSKTVDIQDLFMKASLDSIFRVAFGVELDSMCGLNEEGKKISDAFDNANAMTIWRYVDIFWKIKRALNIGSEAKLKENIRIVDMFVYKLIQRKTEQMSKPEADLPEKVAQEIKEATTEKKDAIDMADFAANVSEDELEKMQYLHAALTETLRLYPAIPTDPKTCFSDDTLPDGFSVRKGDMVSYLPYAMGRMEFIWGDDAKEYKPERWLDPDGLFRPENPFKFTAFQAGPRICLGKEFAYRQMKIFSAVLLRYFVFKLSDDKKTVNYRTMISLQIEGGLHVDVFHRATRKNLFSSFKDETQIEMATGPYLIAVYCPEEGEKGLENNENDTAVNCYKKNCSEEGEAETFLNVFYFLYGYKCTMGLLFILVHG
ncbi:putative cytochromeC1-like [Capsicum annuum]|nr:putative cytochromeC1-like [Capsicum annuum]KAF3684469.1 putative cytochromeC1-like [Capsicum annuum]